MAQRRLEPFEREVYCADKANMMFKHMERIFEDSDDPIMCVAFLTHSLLECLSNIFC